MHQQNNAALGWEEQKERKKKRNRRKKRREHKTFKKMDQTEIKGEKRKIRNIMYIRTGVCSRSKKRGGKNQHNL